MLLSHTHTSDWDTHTHTHTHTHTQTNTHTHTHTQTQTHTHTHTVARQLHNSDGDGTLLYLSQSSLQGHQRNGCVSGPGGDCVLSVGRSSGIKTSAW